MKLKFKSAPLPFQGQKRNYLPKFIKALKNYPEDGVYVDLFGGSGLLSRTVKDVYPHARVIYNDYDNFCARLHNISKTNVLLSDLRVLLKDVNKKGEIGQITKAKVLDRIRQESGFVDYITLSASILFSMSIAHSFDELKKQTLYNRVKQSDYKATGYLSDLEVVRYDYKELYAQYKGHPKVVFLVDPPYLNTDASGYKKNYWRLKDYLDVLETLNNSRYFYFTSNKSSIIELVEWVSSATEEVNPFQYAIKEEIKVHISSTSQYTDIMLYQYDNSKA